MVILGQKEGRREGGKEGMGGAGEGNMYRLGWRRWWRRWGELFWTLALRFWGGCTEFWLVSFGSMDGWRGDAQECGPGACARLRKSRR